MIKLIVGAKGSGKTKTMIDMINNATRTTSGNIVVSEKSMKLTTEINHAARLLYADEYDINGSDMLYGFVAGVLAGNYDITELFIDGILKIVDHNMDAAAKVLAEIDKIAGNSVEVVVTVSADQASLPEGIKKYLSKHCPLIDWGQALQEPAPLVCRAKAVAFAAIQLPIRLKRAGKSNSFTFFCFFVDKMGRLVYTR